MAQNAWMEISTKGMSQDIDDNRFYYAGNDLGAVCDGKKTDFAVWSPGAGMVTLRLYEDGDGGAAKEIRPLKLGADGVFRTSFDLDLHGVYYDYEIGGRSRRVTADPYARACGVNGQRSMVVDLSRTDPEDWEKDKAPLKEKEDIIYELHVKEYSWDPAGGFSEGARGTYKAFAEVHTTLNQDGIHPTGLDYLKKLGVNHIQVMPVYDFGSVIEDGDKSQFNWGYDPVNYNVPEGSYSTDPFHGEVRIRELKEMIKSLHQNGFRVVMDVVYNHTYSADSWLERTVPGYYYRTLDNGRFSDGSGCGNDIASERRMCGKYILDSVLYWAEEYHMDGFRFDLMGLLDVKLMNLIRQELDSRFGRGEKLIYGEPWRAGFSPMRAGSVPALKENVRMLDEEIGMFWDQTRDALKGHVFEEKTPGFVNGGMGFENAVLNSASAWIKAEGESDTADFIMPKAPSQVITYVSAHDNLTLWDKLVISMEKTPDFHTKKEALLKAGRLAAAIYLTCQGRLFLLSGEEFARTKEGLENSYNASVEINRLDWNRAYEYGELREYYEGLIGLRKQLPGLCDKSQTAFCRIYDRKIVAERAVSFLLDNRNDQDDQNVRDEDEKGAGRYKTLWISSNAGTEAVAAPLLEGEWMLLADGERSDWWKNEKPYSCQKGYAEIRPMSVLILGSEEIINIKAEGTAEE